MNNITCYGTIDRKEDKFAIIKLDDGKEVYLPIDLVQNTTNGARLTITLAVQINETNEKSALATTALNDILNVTQENSDK